MGLDFGRFRPKKDDEGVDWLADDPVPASMRQRMRAQAVQEASRPVVRRPGQPVTDVAQQQIPAKDTKEAAVSIHITVPKFKKPNLLKLQKRLPKLPKNLSYKYVGIGTGALVVVLSIGVIALHSKHHAAGKTGNTGVLGATNQKPTFDYNLPSGKDHDISPDNVKYDSQRKVVNYKDSIGGVPITISQQPLPDSFKKDTADEVRKLAENFSATEVLSTANPTAYLGTSVKGPQTVIFSKKDLLVFIQSARKIDN